MPNRSQRHLRAVQGIDSSGSQAYPGAALGFHIGGQGSDTLTITFAGPPAPADATLTIGSLAIEGEAIAGLQDVDITTGDTRDEIATAVAAMLDGLQDVGTTVTLSAAASGNTVTVTEVGGGLFDTGVSLIIA